MMKECTGLLVEQVEPVVNWQRAVDMGTDIRRRQYYGNVVGGNKCEDNLCLHFLMPMNTFSYIGMHL